MRTLTTHRRPLLALGIVLLLAASAGAFWRAAGDGGAQLRLQDARVLRITAGAASPHLVPGGDTDVLLVASNPNPFAVRVQRLVLDAATGTAGFGVDAAHEGCDLAALTLTPQDNAGAGWTVPPRTGEVDGELQIALANALAMDAGAGADCQGAIFAVHLAAVNADGDPR